MNDACTSHLCGLRFACAARRRADFSLHPESNGLWLPPRREESVDLADLRGAAAVAHADDTLLAAESVDRTVDVDPARGTAHARAHWRSGLEHRPGEDRRYVADRRRRGRQLLGARSRPHPG